MKILNYEDIKKQYNFDQSVDLKIDEGILFVVNDNQEIAPKKGCKHCYGRGWEGRNIDITGKTTDEIVPCKCVLRKGLVISNEIRNIKEKKWKLSD